jgi:purine-nucleoside phosphorylase
MRADRNKANLCHFSPGGFSYPDQFLPKHEVFDLKALNSDCRLINDRCGGYIDLRNGFSVVTGTGWDKLEIPGDIIGEIPYSDLQSFPQHGVSGHAGKLVVRRVDLENGDFADIFEWRGRNHAYQLEDLSNLTPLVAIPYISSSFDCPTMILTQGVGGITAKPGTYVVVADHVDFGHFNFHPGPHRPEIFGQEFTKCADLYDHNLRKVALEVAKKIGIEMSEGVYQFYFAKNFQTPGSIEAIRNIQTGYVDINGAIQNGAPAVIGKSNVIDAIYSAGMNKPMGVLSICLVTNPAQGFVVPNDNNTISGPDHKLHKDVGLKMVDRSSALMRGIFNKLLSRN